MKEAERQRDRETQKEWWVLSLLLCFSVSLLLGSKGSFAQDWKELKGDHFIIYYASEDKFPSEVLRKAESYYQQISSDLGYQRYSNFWQWENRVKIYVYPTRNEFLAETNQPDWSYGVANYTDKEIRSYLWSEGFMDALLPHEMTHLIFRDYVGFKGEVPLWLDEGVAQWEEPAKRAIVKKYMKSVMGKSKVFSLQELTKMDVRRGADEEVANLFYLEAASLIDFLVERYGAEGFIAFCRQLRDGKNLDEALKFAYPTSVRNLNEMEEKWKKFISEAVP